MRVLLVLLLVVACSLSSYECLAGGVVVLPPRYALYADFDNKPTGQPLGIRGATFGEPTHLGGLGADVVEITPGQNRLRVSNDQSTTAARRVRWQPMGNAELSTGEVRISFDISTSARDSFSIFVRESDGSAKSFANLLFMSSGSIVSTDANGTIATTANAYTANVPLHVELVFDMDARTSRIVLGATTIATARAFGISDRGIGRVLIGYSAGNSGSAFDIDNLKISGPLPFPVALEADFDDKTPGLPIGTGGAAVHEPVDIGADMDALVGQASPGANYLDMASTNTAISQSARWQFLDNLEVRSGICVLDFDVLMMTRDRYRVLLRERSSSAQSLMNLTFLANGTMAASDANGTTVLTGVTYDAGRAYQYRVVMDLDAGTYDIFRDGVPLIRERAHGITSRGVGSILFAVDNGALSSAHFLLDSLRVYLSKGIELSADLEFLQEPTTAIEGQPVTPAYKVGVVNILDQPVPDGTPVTLEIAQGSGPVGATLGGASATTTAGVATFSALTFDMPGTYRLVARSLEAIKLNNVAIEVEESDVLFANGFD